MQRQLGGECGGGGREEVAYIPLIWSHPRAPSKALSEEARGTLVSPLAEATDTQRQIGEGSEKKEVSIKAPQSGSLRRGEEGQKFATFDIEAIGPVREEKGLRRRIPFRSMNQKWLCH